MLVTLSVGMYAKFILWLCKYELRFPFQYHLAQGRTTGFVLWRHSLAVHPVQLHRCLPKETSCFGVISTGYLRETRAVTFDHLNPVAPGYRSPVWARRGLSGWVLALPSLNPSGWETLFRQMVLHKGSAKC